MMTRRPNVLFFFTDDQRFDTIRALGNEHIHTPALDRLVGEGCAFTNAYIMGGTCAAVCMPSRAMLHRGRNLYSLQGQGEEIPEDHALLGEVLQQAGYRTFGTGKWHNGKRAYARSFTDGDEIFFGGMEDHWNVPAYRFDPSGRYDASLRRCPEPQRSNAVRITGGDHIVAGKHSSELFCDAAIRFLQSHYTETPFFMYVSFMAPHDPRTMPKEYLDLYDPEALPLPPNHLGAHPFDNGELKIRDEMLEDWPRLPEKIRNHLAEYYAMITHADAQMQRVLAALAETGQAENTIIVFAGDNGLALGQHGLMGKQNMYEHSLHVPLILSGPGIPGGETRDSFCYLYDIFPTLCDLLGLPIPTSVQGQSLAPAMGDSSASHRSQLYFGYRNCQRAAREGNWKYVEYRVDGRRRHQLFDLSRDRWEQKDLSERPEHADTLRHMRNLLQKLRDDNGDVRPEGQAFWG